MVRSRWRGRAGLARRVVGVVLALGALGGGSAGCKLRDLRRWRAAAMGRRLVRAPTAGAAHPSPRLPTAPGRRPAAPAARPSPWASLIDARFSVRPVGPYLTLEAYCAARLAPLDPRACTYPTDPEVTPCACDPTTTLPGGTRALAGPAGPFLAARLLATTVDRGVTHCELAIRTGVGWFVYQDLVECAEPLVAEQPAVQALSDQIAVRVLAGGLRELWFRFRERRWIAPSEPRGGAGPGEGEWDEEAFGVRCRVGAGAAPHCTPRASVGVRPPG